MFNLGMGEITVILLLALIFLGPSKLPDLATGLGKLIREIRKATADVKNEITLDESFRKPFEELRDAVTLHPDELKRRDQVRRMEDEARKRDEDEARAAAAAAAPPPGDTAAAISAAPSVVAPIAPPPGTVARQRTPAPGITPPIAASRVDPGAVPPPPLTVPDVPPPFGPPSASPDVLTSAPPAPRMTPRVAMAVPAARTAAPRVPPPSSVLDRDSANITQALSEADLLAAGPSQPRRPTPPPLPGVARGADADKPSSTATKKT